jgi:hypothetical protein
MAPEKIESFIDKKILEKFSDSSNSIESTINYLYENINKFSARDSYINVSLSYLIKNWDVINFKKKYTTYYVIYAKKRVKDLEWCKERTSDLIKENKIFSLLLFKEKLKKTSQNQQS